jgi:hypothetical protein
MTANELADLLFERAKWDGKQVPSNLDELCYAMLQQQAKEIEQLNFVLKNLTLATNKKINEFEEALEDCTCQGGHSEAYLKAKGKL